MTRTDLPPIYDRIAKRFETRHHRYYTRCKMRMDPLYRAVHAKLAGSPLPLLDIGCGLGILAFFLKELGYRGEIDGIDYDAPKIATGSRVAASHYPDVRLAVGDAREKRTFQGNVTLLDLLQFFEKEEQETVLRNAAACVAPGGSLIVRNCLNDGSWRFQITRAGDVFSRMTRWMKGSPVFYPTRESILATLAPLGFTAEIEPLHGRMPLSNYLLTFRRRGSQEPGDGRTNA